VVEQFFAQPQEGAGSRVDVEAEVGQSGRGEETRAGREQFILQNQGDPRKETVGDEVIELLTEVGEAHGVKGQVLQSDRGPRLFRHRDLPRREVDPDEFSVGQSAGHGDHVASIGAPQFQHAAGINGWRRGSGQRSGDGDPIRVGVIIDSRWIDEVFVVLQRLLLPRIT
jgi:hypothetical protein